ncbi:MAG TPA: hypothetical protein DCE44_07590, partial [Verrucomicrobiales bacterium]|nr:hypothetical protein [Verrucomicrobiales bacterium]
MNTPKTDPLPTPMTVPPDLVAREGMEIPVGGHHPFWADEGRHAWYVGAGHADLFAVDGVEPSGARRHLLRVAAGSVLFDWTRTVEPNLPRFLALSSNDAQIIRLPLERLRSLGAEESGREWLRRWSDEWVNSVYRGLAAAAAPTTALIARGGDILKAEPGASVRPDDRVLWAVLEGGRALLAGLPELIISGDGGAWPVSPAGWLQVEAGGELRFEHTGDRLGREDFWEDWSRFHHLAHRWAARRLVEMRDSETGRLAVKSEGEISAQTNAVKHLSRLLLPQDRRDLGPVEIGDPLLAAVQLVAGDLGIPMSEIAAGPRWRSGEDLFTRLTRLPRLRTRRVVLRGAWWRHDSGPLLAFRQATAAPVAVLPRAAARYEVVDPADGSRTPVDEAVGATLSPSAFTFYPGFAEHALKVWEVFRFSFQGVRGDLFLVA